MRVGAAVRAAASGALAETSGCVSRAVDLAEGSVPPQDATSATAADAANEAPTEKRIPLRDAERFIVNPIPAPVRGGVVQACGQTNEVSNTLKLRYVFWRPQEQPRYFYRAMQ
jgi:hypothetical protein